LCPTVNVVDIQASRVKLQINVWVKDVQHGDEIMSGLLEALKARFEDEGIELKDP
jgi:small-conductance mechanosensitive channel